MWKDTGTFPDAASGKIGWGGVHAGDVDHESGEKKRKKTGGGVLGKSPPQSTPGNQGGKNGLFSTTERNSRRKKAKGGDRIFPEKG